MKRIAIFMLALSMVLTLAACGGRKNNHANTNNGTTNSGSIY